MKLSLNFLETGSRAADVTRPNLSPRRRPPACNEETEMYMTGADIFDGNLPLCECGHRITDDERSFRRTGPREFEYVCPDCGETYQLSPVADPN